VRYVVVLLLALTLAGCKPVFVPGWYAPIQDHSMECQGGAQGECSMGTWDTVGGL
jgi:hypothetical protein